VLSAAQGHLEANQVEKIGVAADIAGLKPQSYQGTLTITYNGGTTQVVHISLTVSVPPVASISVPGNLNFTTVVGTNPAPQTFTITNTGNATLNWAITEDPGGATLAPVSATSGSLAPLHNTVINVSPNIGSASVGNLTTNIYVSDSDAGSKVTRQKIAVSITIQDQPSISLSTADMTFNQDSTVTDSSESLTITNTGSQTLNWATQPSAAWLYTDISSGSLAPGASVTINVHCNSAALTPTSYNATLTVSDSDSGTSVVPQAVAVHLTVS
jgi:hypothetical protein